MTNITFLIGNGFDLQLGLKTRYTDFYDVYTRANMNDSMLIRNFKRVILADRDNDWENWSDLEIGLGEQSTKFNDGYDFLVCLDHFVTSFNDYLSKECEQIDWDAVDEDMLNEFVWPLFDFRYYINNTARDEVNKFLAKEKTAIKNTYLQLNYTDTLERLLDMGQHHTFEAIDSQECTLWNISDDIQPRYLHGQIDDKLVMGVHHKDQIHNEIIRHDDEVCDLFIKRRYLKDIQALARNEEISFTYTTTAISQSDIIIVYGSSIGDTDGYWWRRIGTWLKGKGKFLIIFDICEEDDDGVGPLAFRSNLANILEKQDEILNQFIKLSGWSEQDIKDHEKKIIIELNSEMFNLTLPRKNKQGLGYQNLYAA